MKLTENRSFVRFVRRIVAWPNRRPSFEPLSNWMMRKIAKIAMKKAVTKRGSTLDEICEQWKGASPPMADYRVIAIKDGTAHAEIHSECALRGTGDIGACYRMMEYDREILRKAGGELVILESQASPGRIFCRVAIRHQGAAMDDLTPAHLTSATSELP